MKIPPSDNILLRVPRWLLAVCIVALGSLLTINSFDVSNDLGTPPHALLNLIYGAAWPATLLNGCVTKLAVFMLLWGILEFWRDQDVLIGGAFSALCFGLHPLVQSNTGRLGPIVIGMVVVVWLWRLALKAPRTIGFILFFSAVAVSMVVLSPWFGVLLGLFPLWLSGNDMRIDLTGFGKPVRSYQQIVLGIGLLTLVLALAILTGAEGLADWRSAILTKQSMSIGKIWLLFGISFQALHGWGAWVLLGLSAGVTALYRPACALSVALLVAAASRWLRTDLGAELALWLVLALLAGYSVDRIWRSFATKPHAVLWQNLLVVGVVVAILSSFRPYLLFDLLNARKNYPVEAFKSECDIHAKDVHPVRLMMTEEHAQNDRCWMAFGNYHYTFPGVYLVTVPAAQRGTGSSYLDILQDDGRLTLARQPLPTIETLPEDQPLPTTILKYDTSQKPFTRIEHRIYYAAQGDIAFERMKVEALP